LIFSAGAALLFMLGSFFCALIRFSVADSLSLLLVAAPLVFMVSGPASAPSFYLQCPFSVRCFDPVWLAAVCSDFSPSVPGSSCLAGDIPPHHGIPGQICFCSSLLGLGLAEGFCFHSVAPVWGLISGRRRLLKYFLLSPRTGSG
jgi:hypothetical protein